MAARRGMRDGRAAMTTGLAAVVLAVATPLLFGALRPGYDHARQYISELGEEGAPRAALVNGAGFLPTGLLVCAFLALAVGHLPARRLALVGACLLAGVGVA